MKTVCEKWLAAHAIAACLSCFAFSPIARAGSSDGQVIRGNPAASVLAATVESGGAEQLARETPRMRAATMQRPFGSTETSGFSEYRKLTIVSGSCISMG